MTAIKLALMIRTLRCIAFPLATGRFRPTIAGVGPARNFAHGADLPRRYTWAMQESGAPTAGEPPATASGVERPVRLTVSDDLRRVAAPSSSAAGFALPFLIWLTSGGSRRLRGDRQLAGDASSGTRPSPCTTSSRGTSATRHPRPRLRQPGGGAASGFDGKPGYPVDVEIEPPRRAEPLDRRASARPCRFRR